MDCDMYKVLALSEQSLFVKCRMHMAKPSITLEKGFTECSTQQRGLDELFNGNHLFAE